MTTRGSRSGFTLVEILIVMLIVGVLLALITRSVIPLLGNAREAATRTTLQQVDAIIQARYDAIRNADVSAEARKLAALNSSSLNEKQAEFIIRKTLYRQALPQRLEDTFGLDGSLGGDDDAPYLTSWDTKSGGKTLSTENDASEFFLFALTNGKSVRALKNGKTYPVPVLDLDNINQNHLANQDNNLTSDTSAPLYELVDDWERPIRFYNFPTRLLKDDGSTLSLTNANLLISGLPADTSILNRDPLDPTGLNKGPFTSGGSLTVNPGDSVSIAAFNATNYHDMNTYYVPLLVSAGADGLLGLEEPLETSPNHLAKVMSSGAADLTDNITNRQQ